MLILVATPIGHLQDITFRAVEELKRADSILCEDTRHSGILLRAYGIEKPLLSYHKFNERKLLPRLVEELSAGKRWALISDAGTPCLNDPGSRIVQACIEHQIPFTSAPGPCSPIMALVLSGFDTSRFQCIGFLPKASAKMLRIVVHYPGTTIALESPNRVSDTLEELARIDPLRRVAIIREMTKTFEECKRGTAEEMRKEFQQRRVKGEVCLVIEGKKEPDSSLPLEELIPLLQELHGLSLKEAIKRAAKLLGASKREVYRQTHRNL